jgi:toxin-antitoxin system PIN domain toxin
VSFAIDANLLLYASNASAKEHRRAHDFLEACVGKSELICLPWVTVMAYLRISTHPSIFPTPLTAKDAEQNIEALLSLPQVRTLSELDGFWTVYQSIASELSPRGTLVPDVHLATILRQNEVTVLYTNDADFRRFDFLDVRNPLA